MNLVHDKREYQRALDDFVSGRASASAFIPRFSHLWKCDRAPIDSSTDVGRKAGSTPGFYGLMDAVNTLCETYTRSLPEGCGYRVSEEQFRREVESLVQAKKSLVHAKSADSTKATSGVR
jgi:hypothetical protein